MKALVTGGGGFLGSRMVHMLRERGDDVVFVARGHYPPVEATGARGLQIDLRDRDKVRDAVTGCDVVFHVAAKAGYWGPLEEYRGINVDGTRNVIDACEEVGVGRLVYTSTPSVIGYTHDVANGGPELPYAEQHLSPYPATKAEAEKMVLAANSPQLATTALRPHLIFGPGDLQLLPRVLQRARQGRLRIVGNGENRVDFTYVDNAALAHLDAAAALVGHQAPNAGRAYFISNGEPVSLWGWVNELLVACDIPPVTSKISPGVANTVGWLMEKAWSTLPLGGEPPMTRFLAGGFLYDHWYDLGPATRDFGYTPRVSMAEGTAATVADLRARGV